MAPADMKLHKGIVAAAIYAVSVYDKDFALLLVIPLRKGSPAERVSENPERGCEEAAGVVRIKGHAPVNLADANMGRNLAQASKKQLLEVLNEYIDDLAANPSKRATVFRSSLAVRVEATQLCTVRMWPPVDAATRNSWT